MPRPPRIPAFAIVASDFWTNAKVLDASPDAALVYIFALTQNAKRGRTGRFPAVDLSPRLVAHIVFRDLNDDRARSAIESAVTARLIDVREGEVFVTGWDSEWQRDELNAQQALVRARYRTEKQIKTETEKKIEKQKERGQDVVTTTDDVVMTTTPHTSGKSRRKPESAIGDWRPSDLPPDLQLEFQRFRNHAEQNDRRCRNWAAAWNNWLLSPHRKPAKRTLGSADPHPDYDDLEHPVPFGVGQ